MLTRVTIGWVWLERTLNGIIDQVNRQKPLQSASVAVEESPNGTVLKVVAIQATPDQGTGQASGGGAAGAGGRPGQAQPNWMTVTIVNPDTCVQSQIQVWARAVPK